MLEPFERAVAVLAERDEQRGEHARDGRVHARIEHGQPQQRGAQQIGPQQPHAAPVEHQQRDQHDRRAA